MQSIPLEEEKKKHLTAKWPRLRHAVFPCHLHKNPQQFFQLSLKQPSLYSTKILTRTDMNKDSDITL